MSTIKYIIILTAITGSLLLLRNNIVQRKEFQTDLKQNPLLLNDLKYNPNLKKNLLTEQIPIINYPIDQTIKFSYDDVVMGEVVFQNKWILVPNQNSSQMQYGSQTLEAQIHLNLPIQYTTQSDKVVIDFQYNPLLIQEGLLSQSQDNIQITNMKVPFKGDLNGLLASLGQRGTKVLNTMLVNKINDMVNSFDEDIEFNIKLDLWNKKWLIYLGINKKLIDIDLDLGTLFTFKSSINRAQLSLGNMEPFNNMIAFEITFGKIPMNIYQNVSYIFANKTELAKQNTTIFTSYVEEFTVGDTLFFIQPLYDIKGIVEFFDHLRFTDNSVAFQDIQSVKRIKTMSTFNKKLTIDTEVSKEYFQQIYAQNIHEPGLKFTEIDSRLKALDYLELRIPTITIYQSYKKDQKSKELNGVTITGELPLVLLPPGAFIAILTGQTNLGNAQFEIRGRTSMLDMRGRLNFIEHPIRVYSLFNISSLTLEVSIGVQQLPSFFLEGAIQTRLDGKNVQTWILRTGIDPLQVMISFQMQGKWERAFMIPKLTIDDVLLGLGVIPSAPPILSSLQAQGTIQLGEIYGNCLINFDLIDPSKFALDFTVKNLDLYNILDGLSVPLKDIPSELKTLLTAAQLEYLKAQIVPQTFSMNGVDYHAGLELSLLFKFMGWRFKGEILLKGSNFHILAESDPINIFNILQITSYASKDIGPCFELQTTLSSEWDKSEVSTEQTSQIAVREHALERKMFQIYLDGRVRVFNMFETGCLVNVGADLVEFALDTSVDLFGSTVFKAIVEIKMPSIQNPANIYFRAALMLDATILKEVLKEKILQLSIDMVNSFDDAKLQMRYAEHDLEMARELLSVVKVQVDKDMEQAKRDKVRLIADEKERVRQNFVNDKAVAYRTLMDSIAKANEDLENAKRSAYADMENAKYAATYELNKEKKRAEEERDRTINDAYNGIMVAYNDVNNLRNSLQDCQWYMPWNCVANAAIEASIAIASASLDIASATYGPILNAAYDSYNGILFAADETQKWTVQAAQDTCMGLIDAANAIQTETIKGANEVYKFTLDSSETVYKGLLNAADAVGDPLIDAANFSAQTSLDAAKLTLRGAEYAVEGARAVVNEFENLFGAVLRFSYDFIDKSFQFKINNLEIEGDLKTDRFRFAVDANFWGFNVNININNFYIPISQKVDPEHILQELSDGIYHQASDKLDSQK